MGIPTFRALFSLLQISALAALSEWDGQIGRLAFQSTSKVMGTIGGWCPWLGLGWDYVGEPRKDWAVLVEGLAELAGKVQRRGFTRFPEKQGRKLAQQWGLGASTHHKA